MLNAYVIVAKKKYAIFRQLDAVALSLVAALFTSIMTKKKDSITLIKNLIQDCIGYGHQCLAVA